SNRVNEGEGLVVNVITTGVDNGTRLYWTINHITTVNADFVNRNGNFLINDNSGSFTINIASDQLLESSETFTVSLRTDSIGGEIVDTTGVITITDTTIITGQQTFTTT